eukprot:scaffold109548_cov19-Tisochrysis_lutea.AAC.2
MVIRKAFISSFIAQVACTCALWGLKVCQKSMQKTNDASNAWQSKRSVPREASYIVGLQILNLGDKKASKDDRMWSNEQIWKTRPSKNKLKMPSAELRSKSEASTFEHVQH